jgi:hypothetical protein
MNKQQALKEAAALLGALGGMAGTGEAKRRSKKHYIEAGKKSGMARRLLAKKKARK